MKHKLLNKLLFLLLCILGGTNFNSVWADTETTYTFTNKEWNATSGGSAANWTSGKDGAGFLNNGIQVTSSVSGANGTSPVSFANVKKIVATYNTNKSKGSGTIVAQIGSNDEVSKSWAYSSGDGTNARYTVQWDYATPQTGKVKITCNTTTNSIYLVSVAITTAPPDPSSSAAFANTTPSIDLKDGNTYTQDATTADGYTGTVTYALSANTAGATIEGTTVTATQAGSVTVTATAPADPGNFAASEASYTLTVSDTRSTCATGIDLSSAKTITKGATASITATSTKTDGFTGEIEYSFVSANSSIFSIADGKYTGAGVGATTVTVTATPTGGNAAQYKPASQEVAVTVNGTNSITLDKTSNSVAYGADDFTITATVPTENYNGTVTASSSNTDVAAVSVDGTTVTVTPGAVGTATITVTAGTGTYYIATASKTCAVTVTAPAGSEEAPESEVTYTFDFTDNTNWGFPTTAKTGENTYTYDGKTVTLNTPDASNGYKYNTSTSALLIGKTGATLTLPAFDKPITKISTTAVSGASGKVTQNIYVGSTAVSTETTAATANHVYNINSEYQAAGTIYTLQVTNDNNTQLSQLTVHMYQAPNKTVTLNENGYATYCSVNPMDFSSTEGYTAWRISKIDDDGTITFNKITEAIKGGQGVLLFNKDADGVNTSNVTVNFADGSTVFTDEENKLKGTTAPTYVDAETVYGLSNNKFVKNSAAGNIPAGKAYLEASSIPTEVKAFTFVFEDEADGIAEMRQATREDVEAIFNLAGQRIQKMQKGINIVGGQKVLK